MDAPADPNSPRDLKLRSGPQYGELFEDWAKDFVARPGAWPGGADYASAHELAALVKTPDWNAGLRVYARRLTPEEEYDDNALFVPAEKLVVALRCKLERIAYYIRVNALAPVFVNEKGILVWKHEHVGTLLALAENICKVYAAITLRAKSRFCIRSRFLVVRTGHHVSSRDSSLRRTSAI